MLKRSFTYTDFNDQKVTEDFHFHLTKAEIATLALSPRGGLEEHIKRISKAQDGAAIMAEFEKIILMSVGQKSEDGRRFIKNDEIAQDFKSSPAYEELFVEICTDANKAAAFINAVVPADMNEIEIKNVFEEAEKAEAPKETMRPQPEPKDPTALDGSAAASPRTISRAEAETMDRAELGTALVNGTIVITD